MANKRLFDTRAATAQTDTVNESGGVAYQFTPKHALAQYAVTGCLSNTYYASAKDQLDKVLELCNDVDPEFIGKVAVYARQKGYMKDMPALLACVLASKDVAVLKRVFPKVIDNGKMLRTFAQILRSGVTGRKSFGSSVKKLMISWLDKQTDDGLFKQSVGNNPSMADVIKMLHPKPTTKSRETLYAYLIGKKEKVNKRYLPAVVKQYEAFKEGKTKEVPDISFLFLASLELDRDAWIEIARNASWQTVRMNLNTFARHDVYESPEMIKLLADKLRDGNEIRRARVFPYQLLAAYMNTEDGNVPRELRNALQDAMEIAVSNVPAFDGQVFCFPDVSGSMSSPVTGDRDEEQKGRGKHKGSASKVRCIDVAALMAASVLRRNPSAEVIPFEGHVVDLKLNPRDSIMTNAEKLASIGGGSTNCSAPLALLNQRRAKGDVCMYVSDQESWIDGKAHTSGYGCYAGHRGAAATATMEQWEQFRKRNPNAKLVCIDVQANDSTQVTGKKHPEILNVGGFNDQVFSVVDAFVKNDLGSQRWIDEIDSTVL